MAKKQPGESPSPKDRASSGARPPVTGPACPGDGEFSAALADFKKLAARAESYRQRVKVNLHNAVLQARKTTRQETSGNGNGTFAHHDEVMKRFRRTHSGKLL